MRAIFLRVFTYVKSWRQLHLFQVLLLNANPNGGAALFFSDIFKTILYLANLAYFKTMVFQVALSADV